MPTIEKIIHRQHDGDLTELQRAERWMRHCEQEMESWHRDWETAFAVVKELRERDESEE